MKRTLPIFFILIIITINACCPEPKELTQDDIDREKAAIIKVVKEFTRAVEEKNFSKIVPTLAGEVIFFGTDSSEVIKTFANFKAAMKAQWERYDKMVYGDFSDISIQMDKNATFASIIFGVPVEIQQNGYIQKLYMRYMRTLKKENDKWVIVSGIVGAVRPDDTLIKKPEENTSED